MRSENHEEPCDILQIKPEIDALWSTFRLPVPLPRKIGDHDPNATSTTTTTTHGVSDEWLAQALDLLRLVDVMKNPPRETPFLSTPREQKQPWDSKERVMQSQVRLAYSMLDRVQRNFPLRNYNPQHQNEQMRQESRQSDRERQQVVFHQNIYKFMENLTKDTLDICEKFQSRLDRHYALRIQQQEQQLQGRNIGKEMGQQQFNAGNGYDSALFGERDLIYDIFLSSDQECPFLQLPEEKNGGESDRENEGDHAEYDDFKGYDDGDFEDDTPGASSSNPANHSHRQPHHSQQQIRHQQEHTQYQPRHEEIDPIEFQKQQQNLLEEELSTLASRLKSSTLAMNATLQTQTKELDDMEQIAQTNLDSVSTTTKKVEDRLKSKKGWKKRLATWSLIGVVVGMWVFCFMVIRTVPKRQIVFGGGRPGRGSGSGIGISALWKNCKEYLHGLFGETEEQRYYREQKEQLLREELEREMERQKREKEMREEKRREARRERQRQQQEQELYQEELRRQEQKKEEERIQKQQQEYEKKHTEQECEILGDGTQVCSEAEKDEHAYKKVDIKAHEMAAERRRQRIEERMRNAPTVTAIDVTEDLSQKMKHDEPVLGDDELTGNGKSKDLYVDEEGNRCIPTTAKIHQIMNALDSLGETMVNMHAAIGRMPPQANKDRYTQALQSISSNVERNIAELEQAKIDARNTWLNVNRNEAYTKRTDRSLDDIPFCLGDVQDGEQPSILENANNRDEPLNVRLHGEDAMEGGNQREQLHQQMGKERAATDGRGRVATKIAAERLRLEEEQQKNQLEQEAKLEEQKRIANEEQRKREENERPAAEERANCANETVVSKQLLLEDRRKRTAEEEQLQDLQGRLERERAEDDERVRMATEMQSDRLRLKEEQKRTDAEKQRKKEIEQAEEEERVRVAREIKSEQFRLEEEQKRIADEEKRRRELQERDQAAAKEKTRVAKEMEVERLRLEDAARMAEEKRKRDSEEAARIAAEVEAKRLRLEEERKQKEKAAAEARIIAQKKADLERERLEREQMKADLLAKEEKSKQEIENIKKLALKAANQAMELSKEFVLEDPDFIAADVRFAAGRVKNDLLAHYISVMPEMVDARDGSGWSPIHEAARAGNVCGVQLLISAGADVSLRTGRGGKGGTALWWAIKRYGEDHDVVKLLRAHDAPEIGPDS